MQAFWVRWRKEVLRFALAGVILGLFAGVYLRVAADYLPQRNGEMKDRLGGDQKHNVSLAVRAAEDRELDFDEGLFSALGKWWPHYTDGVVNPLWPWVAGRLVGEGHVEGGGAVYSVDDAGVYERGRWLHVVVTCWVLVLLGAVMLWRFSVPGALVVLLAGGFGALLPRCAYFQPEPLYYVLFFGCWVLGLILLRSNVLVGYALFGLLVAGAYLTKASVQVFLGMFLFVSCYRAFGVWWRRRDEPEAEAGYSVMGHVLGLGVLALVFFAVAGPRLGYAKDFYGERFHSYPSYWMWMEDFEEGFEWMRENGSKEQLEGVVKPSAVGYLRDRTVGEVSGRLVDGVWDTGALMLMPKAAKAAQGGEEERRPWKHLLPQRGLVLGCLLLFAVVLWVTKLWVRATEEGHPQIATGWFGSLRGSAAMLVVGGFLFYLLAHGWYTPIGRGERFMLALYLPLVFSGVWACENLRGEIAAMRPGWRWFSPVYLGVMGLVALGLVVRVMAVMWWPVFEG